MCLSQRNFRHGGRLWHVQTRVYCYRWEGDPIRQLVLCENSFGLRDVWELNPEELGSVLLMASAIWWGNHFRWRPPWLEKAVRAAFQIYRGICLTAEENTENIGQGSRVVWHYSLRRLDRLFRDSIGWPAEHQSTSVTRGWLQSALRRHKCLSSCRSKGFPASANFESKLPVSALMWSAKNGIPKSS
jgi:hypothetical protein